MLHLLYGFRLKNGSAFRPHPRRYECNFPKTSFACGPCYLEPEQHTDYQGCVMSAASMHSNVATMQDIECGHEASLNALQADARAADAAGR